MCDPGLDEASARCRHRATVRGSLGSRVAAHRTLEPHARLHHPAVDDVGRRGAVRGGVRCKECHDMGDLLGLGDAAERDGALELGLRGRIRQRDLVDRRVDRPGATPTTVIPCGASSTPAVRVSIRTPPLARQYGALPGIGQSSWIELMLMIRPPPPWLIICWPPAGHRRRRSSGRSR